MVLIPTITDLQKNTSNVRVISIPWVIMYGCPNHHRRQAISGMSMPKTNKQGANMLVIVLAVL
jgi:hypothetical protein